MKKKNIIVFFLSILFVCEMLTPAFAFVAQFGDSFTQGDNFPEITWVVERGWMDLKNNKFMTYERVRKGEFAMILARVTGVDRNMKNPTKPSLP